MVILPESVWLRARSQTHRNVSEVELWRQVGYFTPRLVWRWPITDIGNMVDALHSISGVLHAMPEHFPAGIPREDLWRWVPTSYIRSHPLIRVPRAHLGPTKLHFGVDAPFGFSSL